MTSFLRYTAILATVALLLLLVACTVRVTATPSPTQTPTPTPTPTIKPVIPTATSAPPTSDRSTPVRKLPKAAPRETSQNSGSSSDLVRACRNFQTQYLRSRRQGLSNDQIVAELSKTMTQQQIKTMALTCTVVLESAVGK